MKDVGLQVNPKKCSTINVKRGAQVLDENNAKVDEITVLQNLKDGEHYKFLGILETMKQEDRLVLDQAIKVFLSRMSVIWSSPLSDHNRVIASNQFALPAMSYQMWTQQWPVADLKQVDREVRKIISSNGGNHPLSSTALLYLPRDLGGRGLRSVESTYKECKIKGAIKLYQTTDPKMETVRSFEEQALKRGHKSVIKDAARFAKEYDLTISLEHPEPTCCLENGTKVNNAKIGDSLKSQRIEQLMNTIRDQKWQGKLIAHRWDDDSLRVKNCFAWLSNWTSCPTHTIAGMSELYEQMLPTRVYYGKKVGSQQETTMTCRMCHSKMETVQHVLSGCSAIAQSKYLWRHNAALKIVFFEILKDLDLIKETPPWYSPKQPKAKYESSNAEVYWDVPVWAESTELSANRIDARIINHEAKTVSLLEMSCPWVENRGKKDLEKTTKYAPMRWEMKQRYPGYSVEQHNIIVDVLGGWSKDVEKTIQKLTGKKARFVMEKIQKSVISNTLNIARTFKIQC